MSNPSWTFDRLKLTEAVDKLKPMSGSKITPVPCDFLRFSIVPDSNQQGKVQVFLYAVRSVTFTCIKLGEIECNQEGLVGDHFLIELNKFLKVLKASSKEKIVIERTREAIYSEQIIDEDGRKKLEQDARYCVKTESKNSFSTIDINKFPDFDFSEGSHVVTYTSGSLPDMWNKAIVARGELDIQYCCMHIDGSFCTFDGKFISVVSPKNVNSNRFTDPNDYFSVNLESNITSIINQMKGDIIVMKSPGDRYLILIDDQNGIYFSVSLSTKKKIPYGKILDNDYSREIRISKPNLESALKRGAIFIDEQTDSRLNFETVQSELGMPCLKIWAATSETSFSEEIPIESMTEGLDSKYNAKNFLKAVENCDTESILLKWRNIDKDGRRDRGMLVIEDSDSYIMNQFIPSQI